MIYLSLVNQMLLPLYSNKWLSNLICDIVDVKYPTVAVPPSQSSKRSRRQAQLRRRLPRATAVGVTVEPVGMASRRHTLMWYNTRGWKLDPWSF